MTRLSISKSLIQETINRLQVGGRRQEERAVLWLARQTVQVPVPVAEVYEPEQVTDVDYFRLPPASMQALNAYLRTRRLRIAAQVHTHPGRAYHSKVDDEWAFVRHEGALSLVLPHFASTTMPTNFLQQVMTYRLSPRNTWELAPNRGPDAELEISP
ncbi:Mov34/MPN/PAD-1 family protein [Rhizobium leguminosarum]|jgi:proteasome lid subunit RPN8/RPN11|uniref:Mov34/MPN/PAD-1 family protein n=1 Tax=Rhizobium leguminosarum TaxID=384 RepID=UPI001030949D|nr:Mov34/MPN/PAD-1 family protein [Rhizobium leguminosarum]TAV76227.1 hypothetical protein ELI28_23035 [Rhizobium leguminosarum]TAV80826.1 hypothetical protein ELI27_23020 [Rhizobium leguminosarum]TAZ32552.1 hypothetical protein ELH73_23025 [Rhizobium leguminosarum]